MWRLCRTWAPSPSSRAMDRGRILGAAGVRGIGVVRWSPPQVDGDRAPLPTPAPCSVRAFPSPSARLVTNVLRSDPPRVVCAGPRSGQMTRSRMADPADDVDSFDDAFHSRNRPICPTCHSTKLHVSMTGLRSLGRRESRAPAPAWNLTSVVQASGRRRDRPPDARKQCESGPRSRSIPTGEIGFSEGHTSESPAQADYPHDGVERQV